MRPCFEEAWVFVVPLRSGGGTRLKILEAMSMECPVVSTIIGADGIPAEKDHHLLLAGSPAEFSRQVNRLIDDPPLCSHIAHEASIWVRQKHDWERLVAKASE